MHVEHPVFKQPQDENEKLWRYMDFTKFVSLLETQALYFTRADKVGDPFEGSYTRQNVMAVENGIPEAIKEYSTDILKMWSESNRKWPKYNLINCWHLNNHESAAMWKLYLKSNEGIAIQSTYKKFRECFSDVKENVYIGRVEYIDYETEAFTGGNIFVPFLHKRKSFEHEQEVRAVITRWPEKNQDETVAHGIHVPVNLNALIEGVHLAPDAPDWISDLVRQVIKRYGFDYPVKRSDLNKEPLY